MISSEVWTGMLRVLPGLCLVCSLACAQQTNPGWHDQVRKCVRQQDWSAALEIVDREIARAPHDIDVRAWRARVLLWSGEPEDAERAYHEILSIAPQDPDHWLGLAAVLRERSIASAPGLAANLHYFHRYTKRSNK
jgi:cytochrome c-type biogenesis protein CcmH/NrfG